MGCSIRWWQIGRVDLKSQWLKPPAAINVASGCSHWFMVVADWFEAWRLYLGMDANTTTKTADILKGRHLTKVLPSTFGAQIEVSIDYSNYVPLFIVISPFPLWKGLRSSVFSLMFQCKCFAYCFLLQIFLGIHRREMLFLSYRMFLLPVVLVCVCVFSYIPVWTSCDCFLMANKFSDWLWHFPNPNQILFITACCHILTRWRFERNRNRPALFPDC